MILQTKDMYKRVIQVLRAQHPQCKTDLEALQREKEITLLWKEHCDKCNYDATEQIKWIAALDRIIGAVKADAERFEIATN